MHLNIQKKVRSLFRAKETQISMSLRLKTQGLGFCKKILTTFSIGFIEVAISMNQVPGEPALGLAL